MSYVDILLLLGSTAGFIGTNAFLHRYVIADEVAFIWAAIICAAIANTLFVGVLKSGGSLGSWVAISMALNLLISTAIGAFHTPLTTTQFIGISAVLCGVIVLTFNTQGGAAA